MARFADAEQILAAAEQWKRRCLLGYGSVFSDRSLWTRSNFQELQKVYVENLDDRSKDSFVVKLERQLGPASADAKCLWAEMTWVYRLIQSSQSMGATSKRETITQIWQWSEREFPEDHDLMSDDVLGAGVVNASIGYNTLAWKEFRFFVVAILKWCSLERNHRESLLKDPWRFASWLDSTKVAANRMFRHAILFLLFPDEFEAIVSSKGKRRIVDRLKRDINADDSSPVGIDKAIFAIRHHLEEKHGWFRFYDPEIKKLWQHPPPNEPPGQAQPGQGTIYTQAQAQKDLFIDSSRFNRLLSSIKSGKNLILQGPPGTGKTFIARRIAWCLIGRKDNGPTEMVQFHQSYAYEDFVEGFRPTKGGGFDLKTGVFQRFCERARANTRDPHVFIIDEINRGNLSRIFGELLMLIEHDKRSEDYAVALTYSDKRFHVPENVFILGMTNTADRSLALVDYALRRRFAFETLEPAYGRLAFEEHLSKKGASSDLVGRISKRMAKLNKAIRDDKELGPGFQIGHSYFVPGNADELSDDWYKRIVDTQIAPLLREYWFDAPEDVEKEVTRLVGGG